MANDVKFELFQDIDEQYRWRLIAANGEIVAASEGYTRLESARRSAERVQELAEEAAITEADDL